MKKLLFLILIVALVGAACQTQSEEPAVAEVTVSKGLDELVEIEQPPTPIAEIGETAVQSESVETDVVVPTSKEVMDAADEEPVVDLVFTKEVAQRGFDLIGVGPAQLIRGEYDDGTVYFIVRTTDDDKAGGASFDTGEMPVNFETNAVATTNVEFKPGQWLRVAAYKLSPPCYIVGHFHNGENVVDYDECSPRAHEINNLAEAGR